MMEVQSTSEASVNFYQTTRRNNPEDSHFLYLFFMMGRFIKAKYAYLTADYDVWR
jgi:hypothetical protein